MVSLSIFWLFVFGKYSGRMQAKKPTLEQIDKWHEKHFTENWKFNPMPRVREMKKSARESVMRTHSWGVYKYLFNYNTMDQIIIVVKIVNYNTNREANIGVLFCELYSGMTSTRRKLVNKEHRYDDVVFTFYSATPSYVSCDGEYRSSFNTYRSLHRTKKKYPVIWNDLEEKIRRIMSRRNWSMHTNYFYPKLEQELKNFTVEAAVKNSMLPFSLMLISWFNYVYSLMLGVTEININEAFKEIFLEHRESDVQFMRKMVERHGADKLSAFYYQESRSHANFHETRISVHCGYKMIPLNIKETQDPLNPIYKPWREYYISAKLGDLVVNSVAPNFSIILDWFYIKNSRKGLYDNKSQYDRMRYSEAAKDILHTLYEAQRSTYFAAIPEGELIQDPKKRKWASGKFRKLNDHIDHAINYTKRDIIMSEVTLAFVSEYVGRTVMDSISLSAESKVYRELIGDPFSAGKLNSDFFHKYVFEICYGLLCANKKIGVIHGDLHLGNATIGELYRMSDDRDGKKKVLYVVDDKHQYLFPNRGYFANIIDFSRGIIDPHRKDMIKDLSLPPTFEQIRAEDELAFDVREREDLMNLYLRIFPSKAKQKEELAVLFKNHFRAVFKLLTCLDLYMFSIRMWRVLSVAERKVPMNLLSLLEKVNKDSEFFITAEMSRLISDPSRKGPEIANGEYPILTIIKKHFSAYNDGEKYGRLPGEVSDVYVLDNLMEHSLVKYDLFPDYVKSSGWIDEDGKDHVNNVFRENREKTRAEFEQQKKDNLFMMRYIAKRHMDKLM
jgi:hypothetical protein